MRRLLSFCLLLAEAVAAWGYTAKIDGIYYDINSSNHTATVTYRDQNYVSYSGEVVVPASVEYEGEAYSVTKIGERAFGNCTSLQSVSLPNSITAIHDFAFVGCSNLTEIEIPQGVTAIQTRTFEDCFSLASVKIPEGVTTIGSSAFEYCTSLETIDLPKSLASIVELAFYQCRSLRSITIPENVTTIDGRTFEGCYALQSIHLSKNIVSIGEQAFYGCSALSEITLPESVTSIGKNAFTSQILSVTVSGNTPAILEQDAFRGNTIFFVPNVDVYKAAWSDYQFIVPKNGTAATVHLEAMSDKSALQQTLGVDSMQKITSLTVSGTINGYDIMMMRNQMPNLLDIDLRDAHIVANDHEYTKGYHSKQDTLTAYSFTGTGTHIRKAVLPNSVVWIEQNVFNAAYLREVVLPENLQAVGDSTFLGCSALSTLTLPETLATIGKSAFQGTGLLSVSLPANVKTIGEKAFAGGGDGGGGYYTRYYDNAHSNLVYNAANAPESGGLLQTLIIPKDSKLTTISRYAFAGNNNLRDVSILGDSIRKIETGAFNHCLLDTIILPPHLTALDTLAFAYCTGLKFVAMPNTLTEVPSNAFIVCTNLDNVQFPKKLTKIGHHAFADCTNLRNVDIPGLVTNIEDYAFKDCQVKSVYSYLFDPFKIGQNTFSPYANANAILYVPNVEDTEMKYLYDTQWSQFIHRKRMDKDFAYDDFYGKGDITIRCEDDPLKGNPNAILYPGAGLTVEEGVCDTTGIGNIVIGSDGDEAWGAVIAGCNLRVDSLIQNITIMGKKWYFLGFPFEVRIDDIYANAKYVIYEYDGQIRADRDTTGWKRVPKDQEYLYPGHGYIFQFNFATSGDISIVVPSPDFCHLIEQIILKFFPSDKANNKSWNYASNPFLGYYNIDDLNTTAPITIWDVATSNYRTVRPGDDEYYFSPYEGFFLQNAEEKDAELTFDRSKAMTKQQMDEQHKQRRQVAGRTPEQDKERAIINLILASETASDNTRIVINDGAGLGYDLGADAAKFLTTDNGVPQIFSYDNENIEYAINERPMGTGTIELGVRLPKAGMYTISTARMDTAFYLLDRDQDRLHDFADGDYIFSAGAGMHTSRFALVRSRIPQDIDNATNDVRVEPAENGLYIQGNKPITVYNAAGMLVASGIENGLLPLPAGVYMVVAGSNAEKYIVK